jgi:uncharacterized BrkB/YihY/UPF0761 family membrane protein
VGLLSGILVNVINQKIGRGVLPWNDPVIISSAILFVWLLISLLFNLVYRPARQGRKVAYLVLASLLFLVVEFAIVLYVGHATRGPVLQGRGTTGVPAVAVLCTAQLPACGEAG